MSLPPEIIMEDRPCPLGCKAESTTVLAGYDRLHGLPGTFTVVRCKQCGLLRTNPRPTADTIGYYYPSDYGPYRGTLVTQTESAPFKRSSPLRKAIGHLFQFNNQRLPPLPPGRMLEIGCASGAFIHYMAHNGWEVAGIEPDPTAAQATRQLGYPVFTGNLESASAPSELYDLVVGWMVVEHLHEPVTDLQKLHRWTRPGARFVFSVPNAGSLEFALFKDAWFALQVPTHLYHYTPRTIRLVLERSGWQVERIFHQRLLGNLAASMGYVLRDRGINRLAKPLLHFPEASWRWQQAAFPAAWMLGLFGQTGRMTVWASRVDD